jgi:hypothetical protein
VVFGHDGEDAEIEQQPLSRSVLGAHVLYKMEVFVVLLTARIALAPALDIQAREAYRAYPRVSIIS